ncbi:hypothetical protein MEO94_22635 [Dolichospermum sp. ST_sed9]|nr:hypothetical protein [Dolichospermum sp. ST_sed9]
MKIKRLNARLSDRRYYKLQSYTAISDKTITQLIEDYIYRQPTNSQRNKTNTLTKTQLSPLFVDATHKNYKDDVLFLSRIHPTLLRVRRGASADKAKTISK